MAGIPDELDLIEDEVKHVRARRLSPGDLIHLGDGMGSRHTCVLAENLKTIRFTGETVTNEEPERILFTAVPSGKRWDWLLQKAVESGVSVIIPVNYRRSERMRQNMDREKRIILEASAQSRRFKLPELRIPAKPEECANEFSQLDRVYILDSTDTALSSKIKVTYEDRIGIIIGPEGGFSDEETRLFKGAGAIPVSMGPHILRVETAAVVALGFCMIETYAIKDMNT